MILPEAISQNIVPAQMGSRKTLVAAYTTLHSNKHAVMKRILRKQDEQRTKKHSRYCRKLQLALNSGLSTCLALFTAPQVRKRTRAESGESTKSVRFDV